MGPFELQRSNLLLGGYKQHLAGLPWPPRAAFVGQLYLNSPALSCFLPVCPLFPKVLGELVQTISGRHISGSGSAGRLSPGLANWVSCTSTAF